MAVEYKSHIRFMGDAYSAALPPRGLMSVRYQVLVNTSTSIVPTAWLPGAGSIPSCYAARITG